MLRGRKGTHESENYYQRRFAQNGLGVNLDPTALRVDQLWCGRPESSNHAVVYVESSQAFCPSVIMFVLSSRVLVGLCMGQEAYAWARRPSFHFVRSFRSTISASIFFHVSLSLALSLRSAFIISWRLSFIVPPIFLVIFIQPHNFTVSVQLSILSHLSRQGVKIISSNILVFSKLSWFSPTLSP